VSGAEPLASRLEEVRGRVRHAAERAGRDPATVRVVAVTKGHAAAAIGATLDAGVGDIAESRVQEAEAKRAELGDRAVTWHLVGHLQRNKARAAAAIFDVVHSIDSAQVAAALDRHRDGAAPPLRVLVEVDLTAIPGRSGVPPGAASALLSALTGLAALETVGLMTIAPPGSPDAARECFARLRGLRDRLRDDQGFPLPELSMGMSDDFEIAIAEGSTMVRLGRVLFGDSPRPVP
jgi:pyridoxal phosphate enzyme (YggS family)